MKSLVVSFVVVPLAVFAATVSDLTVRQNWPWDGDVSIDFILSGEGVSDVSLTATWDGQAEPYDLTRDGAIAGTVWNRTAGACHFVWSPEKAGFANRALTNFRVDVTCATAAERTYLVIDLETGDVTYSAQQPADFPCADYRTTKMLFRRVTAGTFTMGCDKATQTKLGYNDTRAPLHTVTLTSDYYIGVYPVTECQWNLCEKGTKDTSKTKPMGGRSFNDMRGTLDENGSIDWWTTRFAVGTNGWLKTVRARTKNRFVIDLPLEAQWECMARAGASTIWSSGGTSENTVDELKAFLDQVAWYGDNSGAALHEVGTKAGNAWGIYDTCGNVHELCLDHSGSYAAGSSVTDPIGASAGQPQRRGGSFSLTHWSTYDACTPFYRTTLDPASRWNDAGCRLCIHLKTDY